MSVPDPINYTSAAEISDWQDFLELKKAEAEDAVREAEGRLTEHARKVREFYSRQSK